MSKAIEINAAQQIRWSLGIDFPLFTSRGEPRNLSHTKKGPGRRAPTPAWERVLRAVKRGAKNVDVVWYDRRVNKLIDASMIVLHNGLYKLRRKGNNLLMKMGWAVTGTVRGVTRA